jgi:hypothetical protein
MDRERSEPHPAPTIQMARASQKLVMAGLVPAIHVFTWLKTWMPGTRPGMTIELEQNKL